MREFLRSFLAEPRVPDPPARVWRDWVLVGILLPTAVLEGLLRPDLPWRVASMIVGIAVVPTLLWRRTHPLEMVVIVFGVVGVLDVARVATGGGELPGLYTMAFALVLPYSLFRWASGRDAMVGLAVMMAPALLSAVIDYTGLSDLIGGFAVFFGTMALGVAVRYRSGVRQRDREQVRLREREELARDIHDTVAHHVSAIAIRAQAGLATAPTRPEAATDALRVIEAEASRTLIEMRAMVRFLRRDEPADLSPNPKVCDIRQLAGSEVGSIEVDVVFTGDLEALPESVSTAVYRLAQESITNARRHARDATRVVVDVTTDERAVRLRVSDDGRPTHARPVDTGYGLIGMIERADQLGGTCVAGFGPDGGWTVEAVLPRAGAAS